MVASRASASKKEAPTTVSTSSTTLPIVLEVADAPASMCEHMVVGERAGTAGKGQTESRWHMPCSMSGWARTQRFGAGACAPSWRAVLPMLSRPALEPLRSASAATLKFAAAASATKTKAPQMPRAHTIDVLQEHEAVAPAKKFEHFKRAREARVPQPPKVP